MRGGHRRRRRKSAKKSACRGVFVADRSYLDVTVMILIFVEMHPFFRFFGDDWKPSREVHNTTYFFELSLERVELFFERFKVFKTSRS